MAAVTEPQTRSKIGTRGKFATPPVKLACHTCRNARVRCDGKEPCTGCSKRGKECTYPLQSRRGGPRIHRKKRDSAREERDELTTGGHDIEQHMTGSERQDFFEQSLPSMINPGAGLTNLDTDNLFNTIFSSNVTPEISASPPLHNDNDISVRRYNSEADLLNGYYTFIHPFFPILPAPVSLPVLDCPIPWSPESGNYDLCPGSSPLCLAIATVLALVPLTDHESALQEKMIATRRFHSQNLAKQTLDSIEADSEIPDSAFSPARALLHERSSIPRTPFHPQVPIELESILALCVLSVYEYAQRGNLKKMRDRAGQALLRALDLSLHCRGTDINQSTEAERRTWWMTYICICQASIVSCTEPPIYAEDPKFTTPYPSLGADPEAWPFFIRSQKAILSATLFVRQLNQILETGSEMQPVCDRMQELHSTIEELIIETEKWPQVPASRLPVDACEYVVSFSLKAMSKIKLNSAKIKVHRYCAFSDIPVFSERHCDLKKAAPLSTDLSDKDSTMVFPPCCGNLPTPISAASSSAVGTTSERSMSPSSSFSGATADSIPTINFPFTNHDSSRICYKAGLNIARAFESLPFSCPISPSKDDGIRPIWTNTPRTMPSFACCAMQSAYALLNIHHKAFVMERNSTNEHLVSSLLAQCEGGLQSILAALDNYSISFEAISGMRDQVRVAIDCLSVPSW